MPGLRDREKSTIEVGVGAVVGGHGARAIAVDDGAQLRRDLVHGLFAGDRLKRAIGHALEGTAEAIRVIVLVGQVAALDAGVAAEDRVVGITSHLDDAVEGGVHVYIHGTERMAHAAE